MIYALVQRQAVTLKMGICLNGEILLRALHCLNAVVLHHSSRNLFVFPLRTRGKIMPECAQEKSPSDSTRGDNSNSQWASIMTGI